jgi:hypothetical protein
MYRAASGSRFRREAQNLELLHYGLRPQPATAVLDA